MKELQAQTLEKLKQAAELIEDNMKLELELHRKTQEKLSEIFHSIEETNSKLVQQKSELKDGEEILNNFRSIVVALSTIVTHIKQQLDVLTLAMGYELPDEFGYFFSSAIVFVYLVLAGCITKNLIALLAFATRLIFFFGEKNLRDLCRHQI